MGYRPCFSVASSTGVRITRRRGNNVGTETPDPKDLTTLYELVGDRFVINWSDFLARD